VVVWVSRLIVMVGGGGGVWWGRLEDRRKFRDHVQEWRN